jgi:hypothetical protein
MPSGSRAGRRLRVDGLLLDTERIDPDGRLKAGVRPSSEIATYRAAYSGRPAARSASV